MKTFLNLLLTCSLCAANAAQAGGVIIVNPANRDELDLATVRHLYLGKSERLAPRSGLVPLLPGDNVEVKNAFYHEVLDKSHARYRAYWAKRVFTGDGLPPRELDTDKVIEQVEQNVHCVGVVAEDLIPGTAVRVIHEF